MRRAIAWTSSFGEDVGWLPPERSRSGEQVAAALEALQAADATPAAITASSVVVAAENGNDHVYLSPLDAVVDAPLEAANRKRSAGADSDPSVAALAHLLTTMVTGSEVDGTAQERLPGKLRGVIERGFAREGAYPSPSAFMTAAREAVGPVEIAPRPRFLRWPVLAGGSIVFAAAVAVVLATGGDEELPS